MTKQILVTGGTGYLGGRICQHLAQTGKYQLRLTTRKLHDAPNPYSFEFITTDFSDDQLSPSLCNDVDTIIHLAALNAADCAADPARAIQVNVTGTQKLVSVAQSADVKRFIYISTAHIYGAPLIGTISEQSIPNPQHPYAWTHRAAEDIVLSEKSFEGIVLRLSNGTGAPHNLDVNCWMLLGNDLCRQAVETGKMVLRSPGLDQRDFIPLSDVSVAVDHMINLNLEKLDGRIFNLGSGNSLSVYEFATLVADRAKLILGKRPEIRRPETTQSHKPSHLNYKATALSQTGFASSASLSEAIDETLQFCVSNLRSGQ